VEEMRSQGVQESRSRGSITRRLDPGLPNSLTSRLLDFSTRK
jgi:hypothetical protein